MRVLCAPVTRPNDGSLPPAPEGIDPFGQPEHPSAAPRAEAPPPALPPAEPSPVPPYVPLPPTWQPPLLPPKSPRRKRLLLLGAAICAVLVLGVVATVIALGSSTPRTETIATRIIRTDLLTYQVPDSWRAVPASQSPIALGITLEGVAEGPTYPCNGRVEPRTVVGSHFVGKGSGADTSTQEAATVFVTAFARSLYGAAGVVRTDEPQAVDRGGVAGTIVRATVAIKQAPQASTVPDPSCEATEAVVSVLALPSARSAPGGRGAVILVVGTESAGGPQSPPLTLNQIISQVLNSAALPST